MRPIIEAFRADPIVEKDVTVIIIKGHEMGTMWTFDEIGEQDKARMDFTLAVDEPREGASEGENGGEA